MIALGIDSGTQSTKTIALDLKSGKLLASAAQSYGLIDGLPRLLLEEQSEREIAVRAGRGRLGFDGPAQLLLRRRVLLARE